MHFILQQKKLMVVDGLLSSLSYQNGSNFEDSINATAILIELVEVERTFELFMLNKAEKTGEIIELATDCANSFNQHHLLSIIQAISNQLKQAHEQQNVFKDLEEDTQETANESKKNQQFDPTLPQNKNTLHFLEQLERLNLISNLLLTINESGSFGQEEETYTNQNGVTVKRIGFKRLKSLEVLHSVFQLVHPSNGKLATSMMKFLQQASKAPDAAGESGEDSEDRSAAVDPEIDLDSPRHPMSLARFLPQTTRRHLIKTLLMILSQYSHCSVASQLSLQILGQVMTMFDVVDVCLLQKFVIEDFRKRHCMNELLDEELKQLSLEEGIEHSPISKYRINLDYMPSAQINQMTQQLEERVELVRKYYGSLSRKQVKEKTGVSVTYDDLISAEDSKFWAELCKRDFRRLEKQRRLNLGEGHFMEESEESEEDSEATGTQRQAREADSLEELLEQRDGDDDFDHQKFLDETMRRNRELVA